MTIKLIRTDAIDSAKIQLHHGDHIIGRGKLLDCNDKRISREHGELVVNEDSITVKALHQNPCFYTKKGTNATEILRQGNSITLNSGDRFGLLPETYWYEVIHCLELVESEGSETQKCTEEYPLEGVKDENVTNDDEANNCDDSRVLDFNYDETLNKDNGPESPSIINNQNDETDRQQTDPLTEDVSNEPASSNVMNEPASSNVVNEPASSNVTENEPKCKNADESSTSPSVKRSHSPDVSNDDISDVKKIKTEDVKVKVDPDAAKPGPSDQAASANLNNAPPSNNKPNRPRERCIYGANCYSVGMRRVSRQQLDILWEYLRSYRDIAVAYNRSLQAKEHSKRKWQEVAEILNAQGDGCHKDWKSWSKYWVDYKAKLKKRVASLRLSQGRTGGGPSTEQPLSDIDKKFLEILGEEYGQGLGGVQVEPFPPSRSTTAGVELPVIAIPESMIPNQDSPASESTLIQASDSLPLPPTPPPRRRRLRREAPLSREDARRSLVQSAETRAQATMSSSQSLQAISTTLVDIKEAITELCNIQRRIERRNPQHKDQFSHPSDPDWGPGVRGVCPYGLNCGKRDPRHWRDHEHPPGALPPPGPGMQVVEKRGNIFFINARTVNFYDDHFQVEDEDGDSVDYDYEF